MPCSVVYSVRPPGNIRQWTEWHRMGNRQSYLEEEEIENYLVSTWKYLKLPYITHSILKLILVRFNYLEEEESI